MTTNAIWLGIYIYYLWLHSAWNSDLPLYGSYNPVEISMHAVSHLELMVESPRLALPLCFVWLGNGFILLHSRDAFPLHAW